MSGRPARNLGRGAGALLAAALIAVLLLRDRPPGPPPPVPSPPVAGGPSSRRPLPPAVPAAGPAVPAGEVRPVILGQVVDGGGIPIPGARVEARPAGSVPRGAPGALLEDALAPASPAAATTDAEGGFLLVLEGGGTFSLVASSPGRAPGVRAGIPAAPPGEAVPVRLVLAPGLPLRVRVLEAGALPAAGASVAVLSLRGHDPAGPALARGVTDGEGRVLFEGLPAGSLAVAARKGEGAPALRRIWSPGSGEIEILLGGSASLAVVVRTADGEPAAGARVAARLGGSGGMDLRGVADAAGRVSFEGLPPGRILQVTAEAPGLAAAQSPEAANAALAPGESLEVAVTLAPGAVVRGTVRREAGGAGVPGVPVRLFATRRFPLEGALETVSGGDGTYRIEGVPAGAAEIFAGSDGPPRGEAAVEFAVPAGEGVEVVQDLLLLVPGNVAGRVVDGAGLPVAGARVVVLPPSPSGAAGPPGAREGEAPGLPGTAAGPFFTDARGEFLAAAVPAGEGCTARASAEGFLPGESPPFPLPPGGAATGIGIRLSRGGSVSGTVVAAGGAPLGGAAVTAVPAGGGGEGGLPEWTTVSGPDGSWRIAGLRPGLFTLHGEAPGRRSASLPGVEVVDGEESRADLLLEEGLSIAGRLRDREGRPVAGARVTAAWKTGGAGGGAGALREESAESDPGGAFRVEGLAPGLHDVSVESPAHAGLVLEGIAAGTEDLALVLEAALVIAGRVADEEGRGIAGAWVSARPEGEGGKPVSVPTAADGSFRIGSLAAGAYLLEARHQPLHEPAGEPVRAAAGDSGIAIPMRSTGVVAGRVVDAAGRGFAGRYLLRAYGPGGELVPTTVSKGRDGNFRLSGLPPGRWTLRVRSLDAPILEGEAVVDAGSTGAVVEIRAP